MDNDVFSLGSGHYMKIDDFEKYIKKYARKTHADLAHNYPFYCCDECYEKECEEHGELETITVSVIKEITSCVICGKPGSATRLCQKV